MGLADRMDPACCPALYLACGTEDPLMHCNRSFTALLDRKGIPYTWFEGPGGHEWDFWDSQIRRRWTGWKRKEASMAVIHGNFYSKTLENGVQIEIALPEPIRDGAKEPLPVLYLLHGNSDDATVWQRRTSIERYADQYGMAVVMPGVQRGSAYTDQVNGEAWYTYIAQEVPDMARRYLKISQRREDTFVAGLSMGGYGAMHWALREPQRFRAAITLSGAVGSRIPTGYSLSDIKRTSGQDRQKRENRESYAIRTEFAMTYGSAEQYLQNDDAHLIRQVKGCPQGREEAARSLYGMRHGGFSL